MRVAWDSAPDRPFTDFARLRWTEQSLPVQAPNRRQAIAVRNLGPSLVQC